ncbi:hypothetical protein VSS37_07600 [Candidatus Thiothrix sp. Deng01]|uniref:3D domain-containing protein n=1 Tax=Candidatus Thiothrix phosphatis TaxID=3112415 RepID=A0ABU6CXK4_9GAMM|nr:hypothetical protein [Candidatus Thiothrix sp. Deng01]MEB4590838.1 hypothetical protein [Candidatus Thiothrix sp. Deng01]
MFTVTRLLTVALLSIGLAGTASAGKERSNSLKVTATAYNSATRQTDETPNIAAWGDELNPGMKAIAVSKDLLKQYGLSRGSRVKIKGLEGEYVVLDKMHPRWRKKIDIYMGKDTRKALRWGRRTVTIHW